MRFPCHTITTANAASDPSVIDVTLRATAPIVRRHYTSVIIIKLTNTERPTAHSCAALNEFVVSTPGGVTQLYMLSLMLARNYVAKSQSVLCSMMRI